MKLFVFDHPDALYAHILSHNAVSGKTLLLPTGSTPLGLYREMIQRNIDFSQTVSFNLDEYYPIAPDHPDSYHSYMYTNFFKHVNMAPEHIHLLDGNAADADAECSRYKTLLEQNPIDIAFLGIGVNGHIAFNEPGCDPAATTRCVDLTDSTQTVNNINYQQALSVGIAEIMASKKIILLATGETKAAIMAAFVYGEKSTRALPATALYAHANLDVYLDRAAFSQVLAAVAPPFRQHQKILIFSPHPDDDVIGMGATIRKFVENGQTVSVVYQTSGANGGDVLVRQNEATEALALLGVPAEQIIFGDSPFYQTKTDVSAADIAYTNQIIESVRPDVIFFAGDTCDPHQTHLFCHNIVRTCLKDHAIAAYMYYSAWYAPPAYTIKEYFDKTHMNLKVEAIKAHRSQLNPLFGGDLNKEFYQVAEERNTHSGEIYFEGFTSV